MAFRFRHRATALAAGLLSMLALSGCASDQIEYQGRIFDWIGVSENTRQNQDVKLAARAPLVIPPNLSALPPPGTNAALAAQTDWPANSPEELKYRMESEKRAKEIKQAQEADPLNPYAGKPTLLDRLFGRNRTVTKTEVADVPEPDPSDVPPEKRSEVAEAQTPKSANEQTLTQAAPPPDPFRNAGPAPDSTYRRVSNPDGSWTPF